ncbi:MAG: 3,4-dihydroxy-2-butanone-4-phosphate synthase, partial [Helicobacter sp.]|nr:3,4-dihydroxy-2-butanone-4-phosphate synthase [Helicobacter sp.]
MPLERVREAITAIKNGEMVIIVDDEDREDEGDLVFAAEFCTPQKVN